MSDVIRYQIHPTKDQLQDATAILATQPNAKHLVTPINLANDFCVVVAIDGEKVVGVATIKALKQADIGEIGHLYVLPTYLRQGIAKQLTHLRIEYALKHGLALLYAVIKEGNVASTQNLIKFGFQHFGLFTNVKKTGKNFDWYYLVLENSLDGESVMATLTHSRQRLL